MLLYSQMSVPKQVVAFFALILQLVAVHKQLVDAFFYQGPSVTAADILRGRGFIADELYVRTSTGYVLRITRGKNPLIQGGSLPTKDPILFVHGTLAAANNFLINSFDASPQDFTNVSLCELAEEGTLLGRFADEPSAKVLPLFGSNCGREIWLLDRRGIRGSQELIGDPLSIKAKPSPAHPSIFTTIYQFFSNLLSFPLFVKELLFTLDRKFWNYSLDEQAHIDFPDTIKFILANTNSRTSRVSVVSHSAGGAITLMAFSLYPDELSKQISCSIMWAPAYAVGNKNPVLDVVTAPVTPILERIIGPVTPSWLAEPIQALAMLICTPPLFWTTLCEGSMDLILGQSDGREPVTPQVTGSFLFTTSAHELAQLAQIVRYSDRAMHAFDYGRENVAIYGRATPPAYDLSVLRNSTALSFYVGATDMLVTPADVAQTRSQLKVPSRYHPIDTAWNHVGYFIHKDAPRLAIIPSMLELEMCADEFGHSL